MNSIVELLYRIKKRPTLYLKGSSINLLDAYISGWIYRSPETIIDNQILSEFQKWVEKRYSKKGCQSWAKIILFYSLDEHDALNIFFENFETFLIEKKYKVPSF